VAGKTLTCADGPVTECDGPAVQCEFYWEQIGRSALNSLRAFGFMSSVIGARLAGPSTRARQAWATECANFADVQ